VWIIEGENERKNMSWDARKDLLDLGFKPVEGKEFERFERDGVIAHLAYQVTAPYVVTVRLDRKVEDKAYSVDVLYPHWLDVALQLLDEKAYAKKLS